jgi:hypothetical protein
VDVPLHPGLLLDGGISLDEARICLHGHGIRMVGSRQKRAGERESLGRRLGAQRRLGIAGSSRGATRRSTRRRPMVGCGGCSRGLRFRVPWELGHLHL